MSGMIYDSKIINKIQQLCSMPWTLIDRPSVQHESNISCISMEEEDIKIYGMFYLLVIQMCVCACVCLGMCKNVWDFDGGLVNEIRWLCIFNKQNIRTQLVFIFIFIALTSIHTLYNYRLILSHLFSYIFESNY